MAVCVFDMEKLELSSPWQVCYEKIRAFFAQDDEVFVGLDNNKKNVRVYVSAADKAEALEKLMRKEIRDPESDTLLCTVTVIPPNDELAPFMGEEAVIKAAFTGNPILKRIEQRDFPFGFTYVVFKAEVVRFYNDSLAEWDRHSSTLYQEIAKEIFEPQDGVFWTTDAVG